jgi:hypothetical protein
MDEAKKKMTGTPVIFFSFCCFLPGMGHSLGTLPNELRRNASRNFL